ncbi:MAG: multiheme c-type cytochrome, partial [Fuerstiella sp.]|nr:multiheme c-type cytochrome [Fuerstiella sp.]
NDSCIQCHAVRGRPDTNLLTEIFDTSVVDLGIACEACHGLGQRHVKFRRQNPSGAPEQPASTMLNPVQLDHRRSSQICGQCHIQFAFSDLPGFFMDGLAYRAGDDIHETRYMHAFKDDHVHKAPLY